MSKLENINAALQNFAEEVIFKARRELKVTRLGVGKGGRKYRYKIETTGRLGQSLEAKTKYFPSGAMELDFSGEDYLTIVDQGRKAGRFPPPLAIQKWIFQKGLRERSGGGQFKNDKQGRRSLSYLIGRKIAEQGTNKTEFFTTPFNIEFKKLPEEIQKAWAEDVEFLLKGIMTKHYNQLTNNT